MALCFEKSAMTSYQLSEGMSRQHGMHQPSHGLCWAYVLVQAVELGNYSQYNTREREPKGLAGSCDLVQTVELGHCSQGGAGEQEPIGFFVISAKRLVHNVTAVVQSGYGFGFF